MWFPVGVEELYVAPISLLCPLAVSQKAPFSQSMCNTEWSKALYVVH